MARQDEYIRTALRVPPDLHSKLHEAAEAASRTFNGEIVARLEASFLDKAVEPGGSKRMLEDYLSLTNALSMYLLTPNSHIEHSEQLVALTEALKRATKDVLQIAAQK